MYNGIYKDNLDSQKIPIKYKVARHSPKRISYKKRNQGNLVDRSKIWFHGLKLQGI